MISSVWFFLVSFLPSWFAVSFLAVITIIIVVLVIKLIGLVLDAIPFL